MSDKNILPTSSIGPDGRLGSKLSSSLKLFGRVIELLRYSDQHLSVAVFLLTLAEIALMLGGFLAVKNVVEIATQATGLSAEGGRIFLGIGVVLGLFLAARVAQSFANYVRTAQGYIVTDHVNRTIQERAVAADLGFYDSSLYYDTLERARMAGAGRPAQVVLNALGAVRAGLMLLAITVFIVTIEWILLPVSVLGVLLILLVQLRFTRERFERQRHLVQSERKAAYVDLLMTTEPFAKEIRLWNIGAYLQKLYMIVRVAVRRDYLAIAWRKTIAEIAASAVGVLLFAGASGIVLYRYSVGGASLSDMVLVIMLMLRAETIGRDFVMSVLKLYDDQLFLGQLFVFLDLEPRIEIGGAPLPPPNKTGVQLENVSFTYPASERPALRDVSLQLRPGRFTALVGGNGSGKTTLIKILCRLYDPQEGQVMFHGVDVRTLDPVAYRREFSVIFQDFVQFAFSGRDNLIVSEIEETADAPRMADAARLSGADTVLEPLPEGYDTILSRMFDHGVQLSGGQWQKVALARAIYPRSSFVILDEPTSAIDPNAEGELFDGFRDKLGGRGALVISHRLSTIRMADYTYVLDEGRIVEQGTHEELIAHNGRYAAMFERQGRSYRS